MTESNDLTLLEIFKFSPCCKCSEKWSNYLESKGWIPMARCSCNICDCQIMTECKTEQDLCNYCIQGTHEPASV